MAVLGRCSVGAFALVAAVSVASAQAQHPGHQMPAPAPESPEAALNVCRQGARQILATIEYIAERLEAARQINSGPEMRTAMDEVQTALSGLKESAAACAAEAPDKAHEGHAMPGQGASAAPASPPEPRRAGNQ